MEQSILTSTKKVLGLDESYSAFDLDIITHINSVLATLHQLGVGPDSGFSIEGDKEQWSDFMGNSPKLSLVKTFVYLRVRMIFDPPASSTAMNAMENQAKEIEWRINVMVDPGILVENTNTYDEASR